MSDLLSEVVLAMSIAANRALNLSGSAKPDPTTVAAPMAMRASSGRVDLARTIRQAKIYDWLVLAAAGYA